MSGSEDEFSDELDEFEESAEEAKGNKRPVHKYDDKPYDEAYEVSQDLSVAESYDGRGGKQPGREQKLTNDKYDVAVEVSQSMNSPPPKQKQEPPKNTRQEPPSKNQNISGKSNQTLSQKSSTVTNNNYDEALEFSQSGSDESIDTQTGRGNNKAGSKPVAQVSMDVKSSAPNPTGSFGMNSQKNQNPKLEPQQQQSQQQHHQSRKSNADDDEESSGSEEEGGDEQEESYDAIEGEYNPKDYQHLNVAAEVKDLFQYIERFKPQPVDLDTTLKCFIPEYIPAIGEIDGFIKVPRPDGEDDGLGFRILDEPATVQSDATVLELQLRATSKKQQYGDIVVRSIENAEKNPNLIDKWIQNINDLHRSKPPPQVHYKKNMPEIETLMDVWPEQFEMLLQSVPLPSPDLDLSLNEYVKILCSILDIPVYDNPIESLHVMFSLFMDFRDNPHFQAMKGGGSNINNNNNDYGGADVMELNSDYK